MDLKEEGSNVSIMNTTENLSIGSSNEKNIEIGKTNENTVESSDKNSNEVNNENINDKSEKEVIPIVNSNNNTQKSTKNKKFNPSDYITLLSIGNGNFSEVFMVEHIETKILYSLKMFTKKRVEMVKKQEDVLMEKHVMEKIDEHENVIKYYGSNKDEMFLYILYEYVNGGELWRKCKVYGLPSLALIKYYFNQIIHGVEHLHRFNIVHRDLKPENIMVTKDDLTIKLIDFGSCKDLDGTEFEKQFEEERNKVVNNRRKSTFKNFAGTPQYMAPECVRNKDSTKASDCWSLACILYHLFVGFPPYLGKSDYLVFLESTEAKYKIPEGVIDKDAVDLIKKLMLVNPLERITLNDIKNHEFMKGYSTDYNNSKNINDINNTKRKYPIFKLEEIAIETIKNSIKNIANKYKEVGAKHEELRKEEEQLNYAKQYDDVKQEDEKSEEEKDRENEKKITYEGLKIEFKEGVEIITKEVENVINKIESNELLNSEQKTSINLKFKHFQKQVLYDYFNIPMTF